MYKKIDQVVKDNLFLLTVVLIIIASLFSFIALKKIHETEEEKLLISRYGDLTIVLVIKSNIEDYLITDLTIKSESNKLNNLSVYCYDKDFSIFSEKSQIKREVSYKLNSTTLDILHIELDEYYNKYKKVYQIKGLKLYCPIENFTFPFGDQYAYFNFEIDNKNVKWIKLINQSKWQNISYIYPNKYLVNIKGFNNENLLKFKIPGFLISFTYPLILKVIFSSFFLILVFLLGKTHYEISKNKKMELAKIAMFTGLIIGLPGIFEAMKMGKTSLLSMFNMLSFLIYTWIIIIVVQGLLKKIKKD